MPSLLDRITDPQNIEHAYAELAAHFDVQRKSGRYAGIDAVTLADVETGASQLLEAARRELCADAPPDPVRSGSVPKSDGTHRPVYLFSLKDRLKIQAMYRVIAPQIEATLSPFLFSYRPGRSHHQAAKSVAKRHRHYHALDTVARVDLKQYIDRLDHTVIRALLPSYGIDEAVGERILHFAFTPRVEEGALQRATLGSLAGNALTPLLQNIYLNDVDASAGSRVALYRRVGDDIIICDRDADRVQRVLADVLRVCDERRLTCNSLKTHLSGPNEPFRFVGYEFHDGIASIEPGAVRRIRIRFRQSLPATYHSYEEKIDRLAKRWFTGPTSLHTQFITILKGYCYTSDDEQMQQLSTDCVRSLTRHLFGSYTPQRHRHVTALLRAYRLPTLYDYFRELRYDHRGLGSLALSAPQRRQAALRAGLPPG